MAACGSQLLGQMSSSYLTLGRTRRQCIGNLSDSNLSQGIAPAVTATDVPSGNESRRDVVEERMELNDAARNLIGRGADATLVTINPDGSPQVSLVWVALQSTPDGDELVTAHLGEHKKVRNVRRDPRVAVTIVSLVGPGQGMRPYLSITGTARIVEGGAPELLKELN